MKADISIVVPGVRTDNWLRLIETAHQAIKSHSFEMIFVGPFHPPTALSNYRNVRYVQDFGSPARALQIGSILADSPQLSWVVDDGFLLEDTLDVEIDRLKSMDQKDVINLVYTEGNEYLTGRDPRIINRDNWYKPHFHDALRLEGVNPDWWTCLLFIMNTDYYRYLGGIDCRFEHANMNIHDMMFRAQRNGSKLVFSDKPYERLEVQFNRTPDSCPVLGAFVYNDLPLFQDMYSTKEKAEARPISIDYDNWRQAPSIWPRKWRK